MIQAYGKTRAGRRPNNEDSFGIFCRSSLLVVADGLGGHEGGEVASAAAVDALRAYFERRNVIGVSTSPLGQPSKTSPVHAAKKLERAVRWAQNRVVRLARGELFNMGTTLVALYFVHGFVHIAHVGDSRAYRLRAGVLQRLTCDHTLAAVLQDSTVAGFAQGVFGSSYSAMVTRSLGRFSNSEPDVRSEKLIKGDRFLLCSDGLSDGLGDIEIERILAQYSPQAAAEALVDAAYEAGSRDNMTAVVAEYLPTDSDT